MTHYNDEGRCGLAIGLLVAVAGLGGMVGHTIGKDSGEVSGLNKSSEKAAQHCLQQAKPMQGTLERVVSTDDKIDSIYVRMPRADGTSEVFGIDATHVPTPYGVNAREYIGGLKARADMHGPITMTVCSDTAVTNYARGLTYTR